MRQAAGRELVHARREGQKREGGREREKERARDAADALSQPLSSLFGLCLSPSLSCVCLSVCCLLALLAPKS
jgi:hypothetical protein